MQFLATLPVNNRWLEIEAGATADAIVEFITCKQNPDVYAKAILDFKNVAKRITASSLFRLLMHLSTKDVDIRLALIKVSNIIEDELVERCLYFEKAHPIPPC